MIVLLLRPDDEHCEDHGFKPKTYHKSVNALTIYKLVEEGLGIAIVNLQASQYGYIRKRKVCGCTIFRKQNCT